MCVCVNVSMYVCVCLCMCVCLCLGVTIGGCSDHLTILKTQQVLSHISN